MKDLIERLQLAFKRLGTRVSKVFSDAGFSFRWCWIWDWRLLRQPLGVGGAWFFSAIAVSYVSSGAPNSAYAQYMMRGAEETLSPILWNIIATAGLASFGIALLLPASVFVIQWSRHVLISAFYMGCLMLGTMTFRYFELWLNPEVYESIYYCVLATITGFFLLVCYALNCMLLVSSSFIHSESHVIGPLRRLPPLARLCLAAILFGVLYYGIVTTEVKDRKQCHCDCSTQIESARS